MIKHCSLCDCSVKNLFNPTFGSGNKNATIVWVSSYAPTRQEVKLGTFTIPKYDVLNSALGLNEFSNTNSYFTHIIKCKMNRRPYPNEVDNCVPNLLSELKQLPNIKIIVLIGSLAFKAFTNLSLTKYLYIPLFQNYILIGIPHPDIIVSTKTNYDLTMIKHLHNLTLY